MKNTITLLSIIIVTTLTLISCAAEVQPTGVNTNASNTNSSNATSYEDNTPVDVSNLKATENSSYTNSISKFSLLSSIVANIDFSSIFSNIGSKLKQTAQENSSCGQCTGGGSCGTTTTTSSSSRAQNTAGNISTSTAPISITPKTTTVEKTTPPSENKDDDEYWDYLPDGNMVKRDSKDNAIDYYRPNVTDEEAQCFYDPKDNNRYKCKINGKISNVNTR